MREPGSGGNLNVMSFKTFQIICLMTKGQTLKITIWELSGASFIILHLLENMTNRFPHTPDFAWISHALPLKAIIGL